jgi:diaminohydroxyphosphoribosylaminopyrimidine deaminase/5-amino-6-(5-phosphoribosylamino)uracil reductase
MSTQPGLDFECLDLHWMTRALSLARRGIGLASPNPAVGCVLVDRNGDLAGEGWHEFDRMDHAEIAALKSAGAGWPILSASSAERVGSDAADRLRGGTAYVTLEPCSHTGRTGPCSQALIRAGLKRVVAATVDPNPLVSGRGLAALRDAGIEVSVGICQAEARRLNEGFACWVQRKRPFVLMKVAMTLDGRIAPAPEARRPGEPVWITGETARAAVQTLRWQADAVLTGIGTVLADDPLLTDRSGQPRRRPLLRVLLDSALRLPLDSKLVATARNDLLVFTASGDEARARELRSRGVRVEVLGAKGGGVPLDKVLLKLGQESILTLLTETGSRLNTALLAAGLVDRIQIFLSPQVLGSGAVTAFGSLPASISLNFLEIEHYASDLGLTSLLRDPWPAA